MTTQVTQCPSCQTSFRVTEAQLTIANGAVRCGSCLHIFNATEHWLDGARNVPAHETEEHGMERSTVSATESLIEQPVNYDQQPLDNDERSWSTTDDLDTDALDANSIFSASDQSALDDIFNDDTFAIDETGSQNTADQDSLDPQTLDSQTLQPIEQDDILQDSDFVIDEAAIAEALQQENQDLATEDDDGDVLIHDTAAHPVIEIDADSYDEQDLAVDEQQDGEISGAFSDNFLDLDLELDEGQTDESFYAEELDTDDQEEAWTKKLLEEDTDEHLPEEQPDEPEQEVFDESLFETHDHIFDSLPEETEQQPDSELLDILDEHNGLLDTASEEDEFILGDEPMQAGDRIGPDNNALLANIEPEPVVFASRSDRSLWIKRGWRLGAAAALLVLLVQYVAFNFDRLSRDQNYRPVFASICPLLGCTLPGLDNIQLIRSTNLMVRSHPDYQNALVVDAIISNRASFQQRFPVMELQFTNLAGDIVAGRRFQPSEYLAGELKGSSTMPINQPIHISLDIVDPGQQAVSYQLRLHPQKEG